VATQPASAPPYQVIARKYRPRLFSELVGQEHVRTTLENAIAQNRIAHGYIFSGQRGTGKTTVARILARCLNCQQGPTARPCLECPSCVEIGASNCVDVIEIDAASNRGINEMRELRENVRYRPARDRYKVFIIDEAHQITSEAFNALLKTLEEPPEWVVFVLCTTEAHKIPTTVASRCQHFSFRSVEFPELIALMESICEKEGIRADQEALAVIAQAGEGSVRDSLSALDQAIACCGSTLKAEDVRNLLGLFSLDSLGQVARALQAADSKAMLEIVQELERNGRHLQHFCRELARYFRNLLVVKIAGAGTRLVAASALEQERLKETAAHFSEEDLTRFLRITLELYRELQYSLQPRLHLEMGLLRLIHAGRLTSIEEALASLGGDSGPAPPAPLPERSGSSASPSRQAAPPAQSPPTGTLKERILAELATQGNKFLTDAIAHAEVAESGAEVRITAPREFTISLKSPELKAVVEAVRGRPSRIAVQVGGGEVPAAPARPDEDDPELLRRALEHPGVRRFQELFPGSHVRTIRNLRED
jgi:DNA polymerase-3 subunit gamma/tau